MDDATDDNCSKSTVSSDNDCNLSSANGPDDKECTKDLDNRIICCNSRGLDSIIKIVSSNVSQFASSLNLGEEHSNFASRVIEIFKDNIQENVTVNGLPYAGDKNLLTPASNEVLTNESKEALLSKLGKKIQGVCAKRKHFPKEYCRIYKMRLHHEYQNVKRAAVTHNVKLPSVSKESFQVDSLSSQNLIDVSTHLRSSQMKLIDEMKELKELRKNIEYAQSVASKQESIEDTGYDSS